MSETEETVAQVLDELVQELVVPVKVREGVVVIEDIQIVPKEQIEDPTPVVVEQIEEIVSVEEIVPVIPVIEESDLNLMRTSTDMKQLPEIVPTPDQVSDCCQGPEIVPIPDPVPKINCFRKAWVWILKKVTFQNKQQ